MNFNREELIIIARNPILMERLNIIHAMVTFIQETERLAADNAKQQAEKKPIRYEDFAVMEQPLNTWHVFEPDT